MPMGQREGLSPPDTLLQDDPASSTGEGRCPEDGLRLVCRRGMGSSHLVDRSVAKPSPHWSLILRVATVSPVPDVGGVIMDILKVILTSNPSASVPLSFILLPSLGRLWAGPQSWDPGCPLPGALRSPAHLTGHPDTKPVVCGSGGPGGETGGCGRGSSRVG